MHSLVHSIGVGTLLEGIVGTDEGMAGTESDIKDGTESGNEVGMAGRMDGNTMAGAMGVNCLLGTVLVATGTLEVAS